MTRAIIGAGKEDEVYESIISWHLRKHALQRVDCDALLTLDSGQTLQPQGIEADPVGHNQCPGHYTNYMNLLDMWPCDSGIGHGV